MTKEIKDYLHLYLGGQVITPNGEIKPIMMLNSTGLSVCIDMELKQGGDFKPVWIKSSDVKLILRPLSDMAEEEGSEYSRRITHGLTYMIGEVQANSYAEATRYLLSKSFDIFGLIESKLAIDNNLIKNNSYDK